MHVLVCVMAYRYIFHFYADIYIYFLCCSCFPIDITDQISINDIPVLVFNIVRHSLYV